MTDTCDECGHVVEIENHREAGQTILCESCWRGQEYYPEGDVF